MSHVRPAPAAVVAALLVLTGCSGGGGSDVKDEAGVEVTAQPTPAAARPSGTTASITIKGSNISASSERVKAKVGKPVTLVITADKAGELHVHSTPEEHISFPQGTSAATLKIDRPGIIDVEDHALDKLILQLEVR